ncbi:signal peptidase II [Salaquimonas pukyongi]|uniref:signal peptidase II n=1 Tax=Salaquimonas pukyongi TaxID=2712698 RepID=UPI00096B834E|nr:signal peptidase II [Salaquimonas pukyongi]
MKIRRRSAVLLAAAIVALDLAVKNKVETSLPFQEPVPVLPFLSWFRTWNEGIAFSFLTFLDERILAAMVVGILLFIFWLWKRTPRSRWLAQIGFACVTGGAIGNLVDRVFLGHVVDYILFHWGNWSFAVFNLADAFITAGAVAIFLDEVLWSLQTSARQSEKEKPKKE